MTKAKKTVSSVNNAAKSGATILTPSDICRFVLKALLSLKQYEINIITMSVNIPRTNKASSIEL